MNLFKIITYSYLIIWAMLGLVFLMIGLTSHDERSFIGIVLFPVFFALFLISLKAYKVHTSNFHRSLLLLGIPSFLMMITGIYLLKVIIFQTNNIYINGYIFCFIFLLLPILYIRIAFEHKSEIVNELMNPKRDKFR